jgi:hypothetical protein
MTANWRQHLATCLRQVLIEGKCHGPLACISSVRERDLARPGVAGMKRWIMISCLIPITTLVILVPAGAQASTLAGGQLISGKPVTATISTPGQEVEYTFAATANQNVTFEVTNFKFSQPGGPDSFTLYFYKPGVSWTSGDWTEFCTFGGDSSCHFTTPAGSSGTWSIELIPYEANVGSLTLKFT